MTRRHALSLLGPLLFTTALGAEPWDAIEFTAWGARELSWLRAPPYFLAREQLLALPVAEPPSNGAATTREELAGLLRLQAARTPAQVRAIEQHRSYEALCGACFAALGRSASSLPRTAALLRHVDADMTVAVFNAKRRFNRARPHQLEPRLAPCIPVPAHAAYPSGHALQGYVVARVLATLRPERYAELTALGELLGREREIAGLHFPSDAFASHVLGQALLEKLADNARFRDEVDASRGEWSS